jgi:hypothetical protein
MSYEQQRDQNYHNTLRNEADYVSGFLNRGDVQSARERLALDAQSMGATTTVAGAQAYRHLMHEIKERENGVADVQEYNTRQRGDQAWVTLNRPNGQPGGSILIGNLATRDAYAAPQAQPGYDPRYSPERFPAVPPAASGYDRSGYDYPRDPSGYDRTAYPPTGYDRSAYQYQPAQPAPGYDQYPYATPPFVPAPVAPIQPVIQANFGFGREPWREREWRHEEWEREHRYTRPYYGGGYDGYDSGYYQPAVRPYYQGYYRPAPGYYDQYNPAGQIIAGGVGGAVIGALAGGRRGALIGGAAGAGLTAILGG